MNFTTSNLSSTMKSTIYSTSNYFYPKILKLLVFYFSNFLFSKKWKTMLSQEPRLERIQTQSNS